MALATVTKGAYRLEVEHDTDISNPRTDYDNFGKMYCWHRRYDLGDKKVGIQSVGDFFYSLIEKKLGNSDLADKKFEELKNSIDTSIYEEYSGNWYRAVDEHIIDYLSDENVIMPLFFYDHSVQSISTNSFVGRAQHASWDSGRVGFIYATKEDIEKEYGIFNNETTQKAKVLMRAEVKLYDHYLRGEGYGFRLFYNDNEINSCWGFLGELDDIKDPIGENLGEDLSVMAEHIAYNTSIEIDNLETEMEMED